MLRVHLKDGQTISIDPENEKEAAEWLEHLKEPGFQSKVAGLTVRYNGVDFSFPRPEGFRRVSFAVEEVRQNKGGERIWCFSDNVRVGLMVHKEQRATARVTLRKTGNQRYSPFLR